MRRRRNLYRHVANVEPSNPVPSDPGSVKWLWRNLALSPGIASIPSFPSQDPPPRVDSDFMSIDAPETYPIPACGWRRAQRRPSDRSKIGRAVVEESAIESWDRQHLLSAFPGPPTRVDSDFMSIDPTVTFFILECSWRRVQRCPPFRSEIA